MLLNSKKNHVFFVDSKKQSDVQKEQSNPSLSSIGVETTQESPRSRLYWVSIGSFILVFILLISMYFIVEHKEKQAVLQGERAVQKVKSQEIRRQLIIYLNEKGYRNIQGKEWTPEDFFIGFEKGVREHFYDTIGSTFISTNKGDFVVHFTYSPEEGLDVGELLFQSE